MSRDRQFLENPDQWPVQTDDLRAVAIKKVNSTELPQDEAYACVMYSPDGGYELIRLPLFVFMGNPWQAQPTPTSPDELLRDNWIID